MVLSKIAGFVKKKRNSLLIGLLLVFIAILPSFTPLVRSGYFFMQDDLQSFRILEMDRCFSGFQFPCRWVPDAGYGYGYPQFNFYPPSVYYLGELLHLTGFQFIDSVKILFILGYIVSALAMYLLVSELVGLVPGVVAAILYTYIPYKAVEVYVRGALSEFWALTFFPLLFWSSYKLIKTKKVKYLVLLSVFIAGLFVTHSLMSMIFFPVFGIWLLYWIISEKEYGSIKKLFLSGLLGVGLASFFILPMVLEKKYVHSESLLGGYFDYRAHFVNVYKLFLSREWGYGSSGFPNEKLNLSTGLVQWVLNIVGVLIAFLGLKSKKTRKISSLILVLSGVELMTLFMVHQKSSFIWAKIGLLAWLQFPWRFLSISIFLLALLGGLTVSMFGKWKNHLALVVCLLAVVLNIGFFKVKEWYDISDSQKFSGESWRKQVTISIFDYTPIYAKLPPPSAAPEVPDVLEGKVDFIDYEKGDRYQEGKLIAYEDSIIRLPLFDFPGMVVYVDGQETEYRNDDCRNEEYCLGLITYNLKKGVHDIKAILTDTPVRKIGNTLSVSSLLVLFSLLVYVSTHEEKDRK